MGAYQFLCALRQHIHQFSAPQPFHDDDRNVFPGGVLKAPPSCLGVLVHIVVLDLGKVPVIGVDQPAEHIRVAVVGKTDMPDPAAFFLFFNPLFDPQLFQIFPGFGICQHMHQIVVDIVCLKPPELFFKGLFDAVHGFDQIVGQLCGDIDVFPAADAPEDFA